MLNSRAAQPGAERGQVRPRISPPVETGWVLRESSAAILLTIALLLGRFDAGAQPEIFSTRSFTGQFIVRVAPGGDLLLAPANLETNRNFIRLDPTLVPVSCERIKQILWRDLDIQPPYTGKVFLTLYPGQRAAQGILVDAQQFSDGWTYRITMPNLVERVRFVRTMVQAVLLEIANRGATDHAAEVPAWLIEGLAQELLASSEVEIILPPPSTRGNHIRFTYTPMDARRPNPLEHTHQVLCAATPLTFEQLSWPPAEELSDAAADLYSSSAQLFVHQLLELKDGGACLRNMLGQLPRYYNWQFAFLHAFGTHFARPLDVEKWWTLETAHFTGRELSDTWSPDDSWRKLEQTIHPSVQVRTSTNELPLHAEVSLQTIIRDWDPARQTVQLQAKLRELELVRLRVAKDMIPLVDLYREALTTYLRDRNHVALPFFRRGPSARQARETVLRDLDALDGRLAERRPPESAATQASAAYTP